MSAGDQPRAPFFGAFPERGVWNALSLSRGQFVAIIALSVLAFVFIDGPLWRHLDANHFRRIVASYGMIPLMILVCQRIGGRIDVRTLLGATIVIGVIKLLATALLVLLLSF